MFFELNIDVHPSRPTETFLPMMTSLIKIAWKYLERMLCRASYLSCCVFVRPQGAEWVVGVTETANLLYLFSKAIPNAYSVCLERNKYYEQNCYDITVEQIPLRLRAPARYILGPILLGYLTRRASGFFYIWSTGFLTAQNDGRFFEFSFIKSHRKHIVCLFCGTDIRSIKLALQHSKCLGLDVIATYQVAISPWLASEQHEETVRKLARSANRFCDHVFNASVDQVSHLDDRALPFLYVYPDESFVRNDLKFADMSNPRIVHAPSSPFIKGTQLVRAAIKKLQLEGYKFQYIELVGVSNNEVLAELRKSHIAINEFYAFVPGLLGLEAMASHTALITSADETIETSLPAGSNQAWMVTKYWEVYDHLKLLLDERERIKPLADAGYEWAYRNYRLTIVRDYLLSLPAFCQS